MNAPLVPEGFLSRLSSHYRATSSSRGLSVCSASKRQQNFELHVCTNKTCKRQGSKQDSSVGAAGPTCTLITAREARRECKALANSHVSQVLIFARDLAIENLRVEEVGCLGGCGNGPNMILMPGHVPLRHMSTPAKVTDMLRRLCALYVPDSLLKATEKRLAGNAEARGGDLQRAVQLYTEGIEENPPSGLHMLYSNRAGARLASGDKVGAINDANTAAALSPEGFHTAYIRQVEAYAALGKHREADTALQAATRKDPPFRDTKEYRSLFTQLSAYVQKAPESDGACGIC